jgi:hypothetical protein
MSQAPRVSERVSTLQRKFHNAEGQKQHFTPTVGSIACHPRESTMMKLTSLALAAAASICGMSDAEAGGSRDGVPPHSSEFFVYRASAGETFEVDLIGDGRSDLDLVVRGPSGNVVCRALGPSDEESCRVFSQEGGHYRVEVRNVGSVWNDFRVSMY